MPTRMQRVLAEIRCCFEENSVLTRDLSKYQENTAAVPVLTRTPWCLVRFLQETVPCLAVFNGHVRDKLYRPYCPLVLSEPLFQPCAYSTYLKRTGRSLCLPEEKRDVSVPGPRHRASAPKQTGRSQTVAVRPAREPDFTINP